MVPAERPTHFDSEFAAKLLNRTMPLRSPAPTCPKRTGRRTKKSTPSYQRLARLPIFLNGHYANPSLYLDGATIKNDHHGPTDKEMHLSLSVRFLINGDIAATHYVIYICLYTLDAPTCSANKQRYSHR